MKKKKQAVEGAPKAGLNAGYKERMRKLYSREIDRIDKKIGLVGGLVQQPRLSSGVLCFDLAFGMFAPGLCLYVGAEGSAKSTASMTALREAIRAQVPITEYMDPEGTVDGEYTSGILGVSSLDQVFGQRDQKTGKWLVQPLARYHDTHILEEVFTAIKAALDVLPDKRYRPDKEQWYLIFSRKTSSMARMKDLGLTPDPKLYTDTGSYWCPIGDDSSVQAVFFVDSFPAMVTEDVDLEKTSGNALGLLAAALSKWLPRITGKLRRKAAILVGVNQLRDRPMPKPGQLDWYEPAGNSLKLFSSLRNMMRSVVPPDGIGWERDEKNKATAIEDSVEVEGGTDRYMWKNLSNIKNKHATPMRKTQCRVWIEDGNGMARGIDPTFDVWNFYDTLGLITKTKRSKGEQRFTISGIKALKGIEFTWASFKTLVLAETLGSRELLKKAIKLGAPQFKLNTHARKLIETGEANQLLVAAQQKSTSKIGDLEDLEEDNDDGDE